MLTRAFINIAYTPAYEELLLAYVSGLSGYGLMPTIAPDIPGSARQLDRISEILKGCRYSFHDLSYVSLDPPKSTPRFNMPFELGMAVAIQKYTNQRHDWFVFEKEPYRLGVSLSDLTGTRDYIHGGDPLQVLVGITNALAGLKRRPTILQLEKIFKKLSSDAALIKAACGVAHVYDTRPFSELVTAASYIAHRYIPSLPKPKRRRTSSGH